MMGSHLREVIEAEESGNIFCVEGIDLYHARELSNISVPSLESAISFDIGQIDSYIGLTAKKELCILPFDTCWFEYSHSSYPGILAGILVCQEGDLVVGHIFVKKSGEWGYSGGFQSKYGLCSDELICYPMVRAEAIVESRLSICVFLSALNCSNIKAIEHKPDYQLQKARHKRGKKPLFSHWTLELDLEKTRIDQGEAPVGTHRSPRLHLRRGHARKCHSGKFTWVQPCVVGNKALGIVTKDYIVKPYPDIKK